MSYKRIIPASLILLAIILGVIGSKVNIADGVKVGEENIYLLIAKILGAAGWSYIIIDGIINFLNKRKTNKSQCKIRTR